jgi:hypothetical protein
MRFVHHQSIKLADWSGKEKNRFILKAYSNLSTGIALHGITSHQDSR